MNDELKHYGVFGMKWGVRRSGSISRTINKKQLSNTDALLKKYGQLEDSMTYGKKTNASKNKKIDSEIKKLDKQMSKSSKPKKRTIESMSNEELQSRNKRLQLETQYKQLSQSSMSPGKKFVSGFAKGTGKATQVAVQTAIAAAAVGAGKEFIKSRIKKSS